MILFSFLFKSILEEDGKVASLANIFSLLDTLQRLILLLVTI